MVHSVDSVVLEEFDKKRKCEGSASSKATSQTDVNEDEYQVKPCSQPHARYFDRTFFSLILIFWNRIRFY